VGRSMGWRASMCPADKPSARAPICGRGSLFLRAHTKGPDPKLGVRSLACLLGHLRNRRHLERRPVGWQAIFNRRAMSPEAACGDERIHFVFALRRSRRTCGRKRPHQGIGMNGRTPATVFKKGLPRLTCPVFRTTRYESSAARGPPPKTGPRVMRKPGLMVLPQKLDHGSAGNRRHSCRNRLLNDSINALSVGFPGREQSSVTPFE